MKDYTNYDYQALVDRMTEILADKDGWGDAYQSSTGQTLIQLMADVTDHLHYMLERRTLESFLQTAKLHTSIVARASDLGYRPARIRSHTGFLNVQLLDDNNDPTEAVGEVVIEALTPVTLLDDSRTFYTTEAVSIPEGEGTATITIKEGTIKIVEFDLDADEEVIFPTFDNIDEASFFVYNNGEEYLDVRRQADVNKRALSFLNADDQFYDIKYGVEGMRVEFGDDNFGKKPTGIISVHYAEIAAVGDPILVVPTEFKFADDLVDFQFPLVTYKTTVTSTTAIAGGSEAESDEEIAKNATAYHRSNGRAVTNDDYAFWMKESGIADIVDAKSFGEEEFDSLVYNVNNVYITYATSTGDGLTTLEHQALLDYFENIKTSQAHIVLNQAKNINLRLDADIVRYKNVPISIAQAYSIIYNFMNAYMEIKKGSIGGFFHLSDLTNALYGLKYVRNGVTYDLIDYVKLSSDAVVPFDFPGKTSECFIEIDPTYVVNDGDQFIISLENLVCMTTVEAGDNFQDILIKMRDVVREVTPFDAIVQLSGVALDAFGNPIPIEIDPKVGYHLLIGVDTPYLSSTELVAPATIGSSVIGVVIESPELEINHYYYSSPAGRRPMIPLRVGTTVTLTAPTDTDIKVYTRTNAKDASTETFFGDLLAGALFDETFTEDHVLIFEYVNDSAEDVIANIVYPSYVGVEYGLLVRAIDNFGTFSVVTSSGDLASDISVDYRIKLPISDFYNATTDSTILNGSLRLTDTQGVVIYSDDGSGKFVDINGVYQTGNIDYKTGIVTLPKTLPPTTPLGKYQLMYDQDRFENLHVSSSEVIKFISPPPTAESTAFSLSTLKVS